MSTCHWTENFRSSPKPIMNVPMIDYKDTDVKNPSLSGVLAPYAIMPAPRPVEIPLKHLPFALFRFLVVVLAITDQAVSVEPKIFVTLLAPSLWLGLYILLGSERAVNEK